MAEERGVGPGIPNLLRLPDEPVRRRTAVGEGGFAEATPPPSIVAIVMAATVNDAAAAKRFRSMRFLIFSSLLSCSLGGVALRDLVDRGDRITGASGVPLRGDVRAVPPAAQEEVRPHDEGSNDRKRDGQRGFRSAWPAQSEPRRELRTRADRSGRRR